MIRKTTSLVRFAALVLAVASCGFGQVVSRLGGRVAGGAQGGGAEAVLAQSDFTYVGAFQLPSTTANGQSTVATTNCVTASGLTTRYVVGTLHVLTTAGTAHQVIEWSVPTLKTTTPYNTATELKNYGNIYGSEITGDQQCGIQWDEIDQRLYWLQGRTYDNTDVYGIGYSTLDFNAGTGTAIGSWSLDVAGHKAYETEVLLIPQAWANAHTGGKRLAGCCGGYWSLVGANGGGYGPTAIAFAPRTTEATHTALPSVGMMGFYPISDTIRMPRPVDLAITQTFDTASNSLWTWSDGGFGSLRGTWIDTGTKYGVLYVNNLSWGVGCYNFATIAFDAFQHEWGIVDPADLANAYAGNILKSDVRFASQWAVQYDDYTYSAPPFTIPTKTVTSMTSTGAGPFHDPVTMVVPSHGRSEGDRISVRGASPSDYNNCYILCSAGDSGDDAQCGAGVGGVIDSNTIRVVRQNNVNYAASSSSGGTVNLQYNSWYWSVDGLAYDATAKRVYLSIPHEGGGPEIIKVYQVSG